MACRFMVREKPRLESYIARYSAMPFVWGYNDCFVFCLRWMDLQRGENNRSLYEYTSQREAAKILVRHRAKVAPDLFDLHYKRTTKPKIGDLIEYKTDDVLGGCAIYAGNNIGYTINNLGKLDTVTGFRRIWAK